MTTATIAHTHTPLYRVVQHGWADPTDSSYSQTVDNNRWNTRDFPALYCCCSSRVARGVVQERFGNDIVLEDLNPEVMPDLAEIDWNGDVVDVASLAGVKANGFSARYPEGTTIVDCQKAATSWHARTLDGVVCRSASLNRLGVETEWANDHQAWSEVAIFTSISRTKPKLGNRRVGPEWLAIPLHETTNYELE